MAETMKVDLTADEVRALAWACASTAKIILNNVRDFQAMGLSNGVVDRDGDRELEALRTAGAKLAALHYIDWIEEQVAAEEGK